MIILVAVALHVVALRVCLVVLVVALVPLLVAEVLIVLLLVVVAVSLKHPAVVEGSLCIKEHCVFDSSLQYLQKERI